MPRSDNKDNFTKLYCHILDFFLRGTSVNFVLCDLTIAEACKVTIFLWHIMLFHVDWIKLHRVMPQKRVPFYFFFTHWDRKKSHFEFLTD